MKKLLTFVLATLMAGVALAASPAETILKLHKAGEVYKCAFTELQAMPKLKKEVKHAGNIVYTAPSTLRLDYTDPKGDFVSITGNQMELSRAGKKQKINIKSDKSRAAIFSRSLLMAFGGDVEAIARLNEAKATYQETATQYLCTVSADKAKNGVKEMKLIYDKKSGKLISLTLTEHNGNYTTYEVKK